MGAAAAAGVMAFGSWGITQDSGKNAKPGMIHVFRGNNVGVINVLDISGGSTGSWDNSIVFGGSLITTTGNTSGTYDPITNNGRYAYFIFSTTQNTFRYDVLNRNLEAWAWLPVANTTSGITGQHTALTKAYLADGTTKVTSICMAINNTANMYQCWITN
jgi:hypothetical protein